MKKVILMLVVLCSLQFTMNAQNRKSDDGTKVNITAEMKSDIKNSALHTQLTEMFGAKYSLESKEVRVQLNKNIDNKKATYEIRRMSIVALYGKDAAKHKARMAR